MSEVLFVAAVVGGALAGSVIPGVLYVIISTRMYADHAKKMDEIQADHNNKMAEIRRYS